MFCSLPAASSAVVYGLLEPEPSSATAPGEVENDRNVPGAPTLASTMASPPPAVLSVRERIVAAGVEHQDAHLARHRRQRVQDVVEAHRLDRNVGFPLRIDVDRNQKILAVDLQAVAGVKHQRHGIGALGRDLAGEFADRLPHLALRKIGRGRNLEAGIGQQLRDRPGVIGRIGQRRHRAIGGLADHQREAIFGGRRMCSQKQRGGNHQLEQRVTKHDAHLPAMQATDWSRPGANGFKPAAPCEA